MIPPVPLPRREDGAAGRPVWSKPVAQLVPAGDQTLSIFVEQIAILHQHPATTFELLAVRVEAAVALGERLTRIAGLVALGLGLGERDVRAGQAGEHVLGTDVLATQVPAG